MTRLAILLEGAALALGTTAVAADPHVSEHPSCSCFCGCDTILADLTRAGCL